MKISNEKNLFQQCKNPDKYANFDNIKSLLIMIKIISHLTENKKLIMIKYSNYFQKKLGINLEYYKKISGKYKIDGKNGNGKEFKLTSNNLIFEGEYLNEQKNGNGKEYYDDNEQLKFEEEYINGKRNGKGKEYNNNGNLIYEGGYLNGERNGKGIEYEYYLNNNSIKYEGEFKNNQRNGIGKE